MKVVASLKTNRRFHSCLKRFSLIYFSKEKRSFEASLRGLPGLLDQAVTSLAPGGDVRVSGYDVDESLIEKHGVYCELPEDAALTFAFNAGTTAVHTRRLLADT